MCKESNIFVAAVQPWIFIDPYTENPYWQSSTLHLSIIISLNGRRPNCCSLLKLRLDLLMYTSVRTAEGRSPPLPAGSLQSFGLSCEDLGQRPSLSPPRWACWALSAVLERHRWLVPGAVLLFFFNVPFHFDFFSTFNHRSFLSASDATGRFPGRLFTFMSNE